MERSKAPAWTTLVVRAPAILAVGAGLCLLGMVGVVTAGVIMRYVFGNPILGVNEIVQLVAVALAMLALPHATATGAHVRVDLLDKAMGRWGRLAADIFSRALSITALFFLCRQAWSKAAEAAEFGDVTNMLQLPLAPVYATIMIGMTLCALVFAAEILAKLLGWSVDND